MNKKSYSARARRHGLKVEFRHPEFGLTYEQLAFELFPEARTKSDRELEPYKQRIVRAIDAVQLYILIRCFRKTPIRIFPIALPSKKIMARSGEVLHMLLKSGYNNLVNMK